jgi:hypothetical protein
MTIPQLASVTSSSTAVAAGGGPRQVGQVATAASPVQQSSKPSWFSSHLKLLAIAGGAAVGGAIGFFTLGPLGALGGAAAGGLAGWLLTRNHVAGGGGTGGSVTQLPPRVPG